ncbi:uncharacterized protein [Primulina huaijiensis]|uniref:uncharacterized protein n=1 Tax=Primulina huaijiensis TaxID=1492673 RepID=UPI003CC794F2
MKRPTNEMTKHIKPLYITAHVNGKPVSRVLIDNGTDVNILPYRILQKLGKNVEDLIHTEVSVAAFTGESTKTLRVLPENVTVGSRSSLSAFFMVNSSASFHALLGRNYIHTNYCVTSSMHQSLTDDDEV